MTTRPDHHEPLDAQERDLAARLARIGPNDGPSPALDAKILAAAHAAAGRRPTSGRRHLAWLGVPPTLITGVGVAAAAVLALGLVWQLRPQTSGIAAQGEADTGEEIILIAEQPASARAPAVNPPPLEQAADAADATAAPALRRAAPSAAAGNAAASNAGAQAPAVSQAPPAHAAEVAASAKSDGFVAEPPAAAPPPPAPPAPPAAPTAPRKSHANYTTAARASAERRERAAREQAVDDSAEREAAKAAVASAAATAPQEAATLDRIEVTGSRIPAWAEVSIQEDARLPIADWLERVRARRDAGALDSARASLRLFKSEHPRVRLPDDLRALLADAPR